MKQAALFFITISVFASIGFAQTTSVNAEGWLADAFGDLADMDKVQPTMAALQSVKDEELTELFAVLSANSDKKIRLLSVIALGDFDNPLSTNALERRLEQDTITAIKAESLVYLLDRDRTDTFLLKSLLNSSDENIRCIAARAMSRKTGDSNTAAIQTLQKLTESTDPATSILSQTSLLAAGYNQYYAPLEKFFTDPKSDVSVIRLTLRQIAEEKIEPAAPLAVHVVNGNFPLHIRVLAAAAIADASPANSKILFDSLRKSPDIIFRVSVLRELSRCPNAEPYLQAIAKSKLTVGTLASFELARRAKGFPDRQAELAAKDAIMLGHPVAINYVLQQAREDFDKLKSQALFYVPALVEYIKSVDEYARRMTPKHVLAAQAATLLVEIGTPEAIEAMKEFLAENYNARLRSVCAGLIQCKNPQAAMLAKPLIASPYAEISSNAALTLGHFGDKTAEKYFADIIKSPDSHSRELVTLSCWYWLKINGRQKQAIRTAINRLEQ